MNIFGFVNIDAIMGIFASAMFGMFMGFLFGFIKYLLLEPISNKNDVDIFGKGVNINEL
jgi:hypothetical protein